MKIKMTREEAELRYGHIIAGTWLNEAKFCTNVFLPMQIALKLINSATGKPTTHIYCNKDMAQSLLRAFLNVMDRGLIDELKTFDGCFMVRNTRGGNLLSAHAYALAVDLNAAENPLGGPVRFSSEFIKCFEDEGFENGKDFSRLDGMHFSFLGW